MKNKTPEERKAIAAKGKATRRKNLEEKARRISDANDKVLDLKDQISELTLKRNSIAGHIEASELSARITGQTLLSESAIVDAAKPIDGCSGVYFLVARGRVVYVGQSINVFSRVRDHLGYKEFSRFAWVPCNPEILDKLESLYIHTLKPKLNGDIDGHVGRKSAPIRIDKLLGDVVN